MRLTSSNPNTVLAKLLRWSKPLNIVRIIRPNVVVLEDPETGLIVRRAHVKPCYSHVDVD